MKLRDRGVARPRWVIVKYSSPQDYEAGRPEKILEIIGNLLLNEGINLLWTLTADGTGTPFDDTNAYIGVGDDATAASATQTGLQAVDDPAHKLYKAMDGGFPTFGTDQKATWRATFGSSEANFAWNEITVANGNSDAATNLNRLVQYMGTKVSPGVWQVSLEITLS